MLLLAYKIFIRSKIIFKKPKQRNIIVFDQEGSGELKNILKNKEFFLLANRPQHIKKIYLFPELIYLFLKNYTYSLTLTYWVSLIETIKPKIVITFIDNSFQFSNVAKILNKKIKFIAIQNAFRLDVLENQYLFKKKLRKFNLNKKFFIPYFFCLGQFEIDLYKRYKIKTGKITKVGSLRLANAIHNFKKRKVNYKKKLYDVCLISDTTYNAHFLKEEKNKISEFKDLKNGLVKVVKFTINFCIKNKKKLIFVSKHKKLNEDFKNEMNFYKKKLSKNEYNFLSESLNRNYLKNYDSYLAMFRSKITISTISTMLSENLAAKNKVLACNLTKIKTLNFPINKICSIKNCNYKDFEKRLLVILFLSNHKYFEKIGHKKNYLVRFDKKLSTIDLLTQNINILSESCKISK